MRHFRWAYLGLLLAIILGASAESQAENWPRFRGTDGAGVSYETGFPTTWEESDYDWVVDLPGSSFSSPVVWGDRLFLTVGLDEGKIRRLLCLDAKTGKEIWQKDLALNSVHLHNKNSFASGSPVTDGKNIVVAFADEAQFLVAAFNWDGEEQWRKDIGEFTSQHGPSCSPVLHGKYVIVPKDMMGPSTVTAFDVNSGEILWQIEREFRRTSYATPVVRTRKDGIEEVICVSGMTGISGLNLKTGEVIWKTESFPMRTVGSPVLAGNLVVNSCGSGGSGKLLMAVELDQTGDVTPKYTTDRKIPYVPCPVYKDGLLYMLLDSGIMRCVEAETGEEVYTERLGGKFSGSPIWLEGRLYAIDEDGTVVVMKAGKEFEELARIKLGELSYSTPVVANGRMYLKTATKLFCLAAK